MGMFDTVIMNCPNCNAIIEEQSKGGECELKNYTLEDAPIDVLAGINRKHVWCNYCETENEIVIRYMTSIKVKNSDDNFDYRED